MTGLQITSDPNVLSFLFTEDLYAIKEASREEENRPEAVRPEAGPSGTAVEPAAEAEQPAISPKAAQLETGGDVFHYLGENRRFVLVLVNYPEEEYIPEAEKKYMEQVLSAVKLSLEDIALLNYARYPGRKYEELKEFFAFNHLLIFGPDPLLLQIPGPVLPYHLGLVEGVKIVAVDSTEVFRPDKAKKQQLWGELKKTFS